MNIFSTYSKPFFFLLFRYCLNLVCFLKSGKHLSRSATIRLSTAVSAEECIELIHSFIRSNGTGSPQYVQLLYHHPCIRKSLPSEPLSSEGLYSFFLKFPGTVRAEEEDQVGLQVPEDPHDSSTDTCLTFPYSSNSPRPFPPSPVHPVTDSPIRVLPCLLPLATLLVITLLSTDLLATTLLLLLHPLLLFLHLPKLSLLSLLFKLLILPIILSILPIFLVPSPIQDL